MHHHNAKLSFKSFAVALLAVFLIVGVLAIAPGLGWRATAVSTVRTQSSALTQPATISQQEPTPPPAPPGAPQGDQDLLRKTLDELRAQRLASAQAFDLELDADQQQPLDPDKGWLLNRDVFGRLSSAGQRAVLILNGRGRGSSGGPRGQRGTFGQNLRVNNPALDDCGHTQSESSITARGRNIVVAFNDSGCDNFAVAGYAFSTDDGKTFTHQRLPLVPGGFNAGDPVVVFGPAGELYYSEIGFDAAFRAFVGVAKSLDGGATFSPQVNASTTLINATDLQDKPWMTVDTRPGSPFLGNVYVSWTDFSFSASESFIALARSTDGGQTFSAPVFLSPLIPSQFPVEGSVPVVAPNGDVYVAFSSSLVGGISVVKSTDGGQSFGAPVTAAQFLSIAPGCCTGGGGVRTNSFPSMAIDSRGNIHIAFDALPDLFNLFALDRSDIFYVRSEDGGNTYTPPVRLNDDGTNTTQFLPSLAVSDDGSVAVKWWDRRNDTTHDGLTDVYMTISDDGGRTFGKNFRITDANWVFGPIEAGIGIASGYHGDYDAMAGGRNRFLLSWSDERNADPDVFFSDQQAQRNHDTPDFNVSAQKLFDAVIAGHSVEFPLTTQGFHGFAGNLKLSASPAIGGITYNFSSAQIKPDQPASLTVLTDATVAPNTYLITVTADGNGSSRSTNFRLTVYPPDRTAGVPVNVTDTPGFTETADGLRVDASGVVHLTYDDDTLVPDIGTQVFYKQSRDGGATFTPPLLISTNSPVGFLPSLALDSSGNIYVVWTGLNASFTAQQIFFAKSVDGGGTFSPPVAVSPAFQVASRTHLAVDKSGNIMVVYLASGRLFAVRSINAGASFSAPALISLITDRVNEQPYVAYDSGGAAYAVYGSTRGRIRLVIAANGVNFTVLKTLSNLAVPAFGPHIAVDASDNIFVTFTNFFFVGFNDEVMLTKSSDHGTSFSALLNVSNNTGDSAFAFVIPDSLGNVTIAWEDTTGNPQVDIFAAHSTNGGTSFAAPFNVSANSGLSVRPCGAANSLGKVFLCWTDDSPANPDIFVAAIPF